MAMIATNDVLSSEMFLAVIMDSFDGDPDPPDLSTGVVHICAREWRRESDGRWRLYEEAGIRPTAKAGQMAESFEKIARDALASLVKAGVELDEAERLLRAGDEMGTDKWCREVNAWKRRKNAIIDCSRNSST